MSNGNGCSLIFCISPAFADPGSLTVSLNATGAGGIALNANFETLQYRQPKCNYMPEQGDPSKGIGGGQNYCVGSRWLNTDAGTPGSQALAGCHWSYPTSVFLPSTAVGLQA